jgi:hypothetical protein
MGYTVFQEVNLCTYSYQPKYTRKQVTDFDVLGVLVQSDFGISVAVAECKSVQDKAMENLLKLKGVKEFFHADKAYFVQNKIDLNAREVGRELGIWCLDRDNLNQMLSGMEVLEGPHLDIETKVYDAKTSAMTAEKEFFPRLVEYLRYDYWTLPEHRNIINLLRLLGSSAKDLKPSEGLHVALVHQVATQLGFAVVTLAGEIAKHDIGSVTEGVLTRILGGARERRDKEALFDTIAKVVTDNRLKYIPQFQPKLTELVARFLNASRAASNVVPCLDYLTRCTLLPEIRVVCGDPVRLYGDRTLKLARDVLHFVSSESGIDAALFSSSMKD